jgi:hypothetical protein
MRIRKASCPEIEQNSGAPFAHAQARHALENALVFPENRSSVAIIKQYLILRILHKLQFSLI